MTRLAAVVCLLLLPAAARADRPWFQLWHGVPRNVTLVLDEDMPGYEFYLVGVDAPPGRQVERLPLTRATPVRVTPDGRVPVGHTIEGTSPAWLRHVLFAVPADRHAVMPADPPVTWFFKPGNAVDLGLFRLQELVSFTDSRDAVEATYRVRDIRLGADSLEEVKEKRGSIWVPLGWVAGFLLLGTGVTWIGLRLLRRITRKLRA